MLSIVWKVISFPFRLLGWMVDLLGRAVGSVLGFGIMVLGVALMAQPFYALGIPLFIVGLILLMRSLGWTQDQFLSPPQSSGRREAPRASRTMSGTHAFP